jgi:hypothetical protein
MLTSDGNVAGKKLLGEAHTNTHTHTHTNTHTHTHTHTHAHVHTGCDAISGDGAKSHRQIPKT